jgi:hypothetical protein
MTRASRHSGTTLAIRGLLGFTAVLVLAWVGVLLRDFQVGHTAAARLTHPARGAAARERDLRRLHQAEFLNPESSWKEGRTAYYLFTGRVRTAQRLATELVREEPDNIFGWDMLRLATRTTDPRRSARASAAIRRLDPFSRR